MKLKKIERMRAKFLKLRKLSAGWRGYPKELIAAMFADYTRGGESLSFVARRWNRSPGTIAQILEKRGLRKVDPERRARILLRQRVEGTGCFARVRRATPAELDAIVEDAIKITIPYSLRWEFKTWPMEKRAQFIARLRAKLKSTFDRPETPFSKNVKPFDYATPRARQIMDRLNAGLSSRKAICKINVCSQGVIYQDELWFWCPKTGYNKRGNWFKEKCRPMLHHVIWEEYHGRKVPAKHVLRFIDGNYNNLVPENLRLATMNDVARENQAGALFRKSRELTALILRRSQKGKGEKHGLIETLGKAA